MDALGDILRIIRLRGSVYFNACFGAPWGMAMEQSSRSIFHIIVKGEAWLQMNSLNSPKKLVTGDIVIFPKGTAHTISEQQDSKCIAAHLVVAAYGKGESLFDGEQTDFNIVCGYVKYDYFFSHPFLENLPELIHISNTSRKKFYWLDSVIKQIIVESKDNTPGGEALVDKFTEILFIQVIRAYAEESKSDKSYLSALMDRQLSKALAIIQSQPEVEWTIALLASEVGMSRSSLYTRFNDYIGMPPMKYLYEWRMLQAKMKIENTKKSMSVIAEEVGYNSDSAFQKAFKRFFDRTPASFKNKENYRI